MDTSAWLQRVHEVHRGHDFQEAVRIRLGCTPTPARQSRGGRKVKVKCKCGYGIASLGHIIQCCPLTHGLHILRHNQIVSYLDVVHETPLETSSGLQKCDLLVIDEVVNVINVQIRADIMVGNLDTFSLTIPRRGSVASNLSSMLRTKLSIVI